MTEYDPAVNSSRCYDVAVAELRRRGVLDGRFEPKDDAERAMMEDRDA